MQPFIFLTKNRSITCSKYLLTKSGGPERDRTADLYTASVALSQLSYGPLSE